MTAAVSTSRVDAILAEAEAVAAHRAEHLRSLLAARRSSHAARRTPLAGFTGSGWG